MDSFTWFNVLPLSQIDPPSVKNESLYTTLKAILSSILHELYDRAVEESDDS